MKKNTHKINNVGTHTNVFSKFFALVLLALLMLSGNKASAQCYVTYAGSAPIAKENVVGAPDGLTYSLTTATLTADFGEILPAGTVISIIANRATTGTVNFNVSTSMGNGVFTATTSLSVTTNAPLFETINYTLTSPAQYIRLVKPSGVTVLNLDAIGFAGSCNSSESLCDVSNPYDKMVSAFHASTALQPNGQVKIWGENMATDGVANILKPNVVSPVNGYNYVGKILKFSMSQQQQAIFLTTSGIYTVGDRTAILSTSLQTVDSFASIAAVTNANSFNLPIGVNPEDVKIFQASYQVLVILTYSGDVYVLHRLANSNFSGQGAISSGSEWSRVKINSSTFLTNVAHLRTSSSAVFAVTNSGTGYTWGLSTYLGDGSVVSTTRNYATQMVLPAEFSSTNLPKMIGATRNTYFILSNSGNLYSLGINDFKQVGDFTTVADRTVWVNVKVNATTNYTDCVYISPNEHYTGYPNINTINSSSSIINWGQDDTSMLARGGVGIGYNPAMAYPDTNIVYVETGGHTTVFVKSTETKYCYVGHRVNGSMGDNSSVSSVESIPNCSATGDSQLCGQSSYDVGDAPINYEGNGSTDIAYNEFLTTFNTLFIGATAPDDDNSNFKNVASGANNMSTNGDGTDEDGLASIPVFTAGQTSYSLTVSTHNTTASTTNLYGWIDWNLNGVFDEATEKASASVPVGATSAVLSWSGISANPLGGNAYIRLRISQATETNVTALGRTQGGELEDYLLVLPLVTSNVAPVANNDTASTPNDTNITVPVVANDTDSDGTIDVATVDLDPATPGIQTTWTVAGEGTYTTTPTGGVTFDPLPAFVGTATPVNYTVNDNSAATSNSATITITVAAIPPTAPVANDDNGPTLTEDGANGVVNVLTNDTDINGNPTPTSGHTVDLDPATAGVQSTLTNAQGVWTYNTATGEVTFDPANNYNGTATIPYSLCDAGGLCDPANITFVVTPVNDAPVANNDSATTGNDTNVTLPVTSNDTDIDGTIDVTTVDLDPATPGIQSTWTVAGQGTYTANGDGTVTFDPLPAFSGVATPVNYVVSDNSGTLSNVASISVSVGAIPPTAPIANDDNGPSLSEDGSNGIVNILNNDTDANGNPTPTSGHTVDLDPATAGVQSTLTNAQGVWTYNTATGEVTFDPANNYNGTATIPYSLCDAGGLCDPANITFVVTPVNDAPVANNDSATTGNDTNVTLPVTSNDTDIDGTIDVTTVDLDPATLGIQSTWTVAGQGTYTANGDGTVTFDPLPAFSGVATPVNYVVSDNSGTVSNVASISVTVTGIPPTAPIANDDNGPSLSEDGANGIVNVLTNDTDVNGNPTPTSGHTVDLDPATSGVQSTITNAQGVWTYNTATGEVTFDPANNYNGTATIPYSLCDAGGLCDPANITFVVTPVNDAPVANNDSGNTPSNTPITLTVVSNDTDIDGTIDTTTVDLDPSTPGIQTTWTVIGQGTYTTTPTGGVTFTPDALFSGTATPVNYVVSDNSGTISNVASITVTVGAVPPTAPVANDDNGPSLSEDGANGVVNVLTNDTDVNGNPTPTSGHTVDLDPATAGIQSTITNTQGVWTYNTATGEVTFDPANNYNGTATIPYSLCDAGGLCDPANITFVVTPVNDAPVAVNDSTTTGSDTNVTLPVTSNDTDIDGTIDVLTVDLDPATPGIQSSWTVAGQGTYTTTPTGGVTFDPLPAFSGVTTPVNYTVNDNSGTPSNVASITVTVSAVPPAAPIANDDVVVTPLTQNGSNGVVNVLTNDTDTNGNPTPTSGHTVDLNPSAAGIQSTIITAEGTWAYNPTTGEVTFDPANNYNGTATIPYTLCDAGGLCDNANITFTVVKDSDNDGIPDNIDLDDDNDGILDTVECPRGNPVIEGKDIIFKESFETPVLSQTGVLSTTELGSIYAHTNTVPPGWTQTGFGGNVHHIVDNTSVAGLAVTDGLQAVWLNEVQSEITSNQVFNIVAGNRYVLNLDVISDDIGDATAVKVTFAGTTQILAITQPQSVDGVKQTVTFDFVATANMTSSIVLREFGLTAASPVIDNIIMMEYVDADFDGIDNCFDTDSDNDGCNDVLEAGYTDSDSNGTLGALPDTVDVNGQITGDGGYTGTNPNVLTVGNASVINTQPANQSTSNGGNATFAVAATPGSGTTQYQWQLSTNNGATWTNITNAAPYAGATTSVLNVTGATISMNGYDYRVIITQSNYVCANVVSTTAELVLASSAPVANDDTVAIALLEDGANGTVNVLTNDTDADGNPTPTSGHTVDLDTVLPGVQTTITNAQGVWTYDTATGIVTFDPATNFNGTAILPYNLCDAGALCDQAIITFNVTPVNDAPIVDNDVNTTTEDTPTVGGDLTDTGDSDPDGTPLVVTTTPIVGPVNGIIVLNTDGTYIYTPNPNFTGTEIITVQVCDSGSPLPASCVNQTLTITVNPVNDAPIVDNDVNTTTEDTPTVGGDLTDAGDVDPDGTPLVVNTTPVSGPSNGTIVLNTDGTYVYTPNPNFNGTDVVTIQVCDSGTPLPASCVNQTLTITVTPVNDAPIANDDTIVTPLIEDGANGIVNILTNDTDADGNPTPTSGHTVDLDPAPGIQSIITTPEGVWTYEPTTGQVVFNPADDFNGTATLPYTLCDTGMPVLCDNAVITFTVSPTNDKPILDNDTNTTTEDTPTVGGDLTDAGDVDPDGTPLVVTTTPVSGPTHGTIVLNTDGTYVYTPNTNFVGTDVITVQICDSGTPLPTNCLTQTLTITVTAVNDAPVANDDTVFTPLTEDGANGFVNVLTNDTDSDGNPTPTSGHTVDLNTGTLGVQSIITTPQGVWSYDPTTGQVVFNPANNFNGTASLPYTLCDAGMPVLCDDAVITFTVDPVNDTPAANNDSATTVEDTPVVIPVITNDTDSDGTIDPTTVTITSAPTHGTVSVNPTTGEVTYTPSPNYNGPDSFTYQVCDSGTPLPALCDTAVVNITVTPGNDAPVANDDVVATPLVEDGANGTVNILTNDTDIDGNPTPSSGHVVDLDTVTPGVQTTITTPEGVYTYNPTTGVVTFDPAPNFNGVATTPYQLCDAAGLCDTADITFTVTSVNDLPVAVNDTDSTLADTNVTINVIGNDTDSDGTIVSTSIDLDPNTLGQQTTFIVPGEGTYTATAAGTVVFDPLPTFSGVTTPVNYTVQDNNGGISNVATITVTVATCISNPALDCDGDGVPNGTEVTNGTDPLNPCSLVVANATLTPSTAWNTADCDGDGVPNGSEVTSGTDPLNPCSFVLANATLTTSAAWNNADCDGDGVPNGTEVTDGTNPSNPCSFVLASATLAPNAAWNTSDCDGDGVPNGTEVTDGTNPSNPCSFVLTSATLTASAAWNAADCDGDGVPNGTEVTNGTNPLNPCSFVLASATLAPNAVWNTADCDGDGVPNGSEVTSGTDPLNPCSFILANATLTASAAWNAADCDGDGVPNGTEVTNGTNPLNPCSFILASATLTPNAAWNTADCDGDGVPNGTEVTDGTDPLVPCSLILASQTLTPNAAWFALDCDNDGNPNTTDPNILQPVAVNDTFTANTGVTTSFNILTNDDFLAGIPTSITQVPTGTAGGTVVFNPLSGVMQYTPLPTEAGTTVTVDYLVCNTTPNPDVCDTATITIVVPPYVIANNDTTAPVNGMVGGDTGINVLTNDEVNGDTPVNPSDVILVPVTNGPLTVNADGTVTVAPNTPQGTYTVTYQICDANSPTTCDTAIVTVNVFAAPIVANNDNGICSIDGAVGGVAYSNILVNDTLNNTPVVASQVTTTFVSATNVGITLSGTNVLVAAGTPSGSYTLTYSICEILNPTNCDTATVTVLVTTAPIVGTVVHPTCTVATGSISLSGLPSGTWTLVRTGTSNDSFVGTGSTATITNLTPGTYSFVVENAFGCASVSTPNITINPQPLTPLAPVSGGNQEVCEAAPIQTLTATATVGAGESIVWYNAPISGTIVANPTLNTVGTITYYAESVLGSCTSTTRTPVTLTINATPSAPVSGGDQTVCATNPIQTLTATAVTTAGTSIEWYNAATGGTLILSPTLNTVGTVTYYAQAVNNNTLCPSLTRTPVVLTINATPLAPVSGGNQEVCEAAPIQTLTATATVGTGESIVWYNAPISGIVVANPTLNTVGTITYYAEAVLGSCTSTTRTPVTLTINPTPAAPISGGNQTVCATTPVQTLTATAVTTAGTTIEWYNAPVGGFPILSPTLSSVGTVTYYAQAVNATTLCPSLTRTPVSLTINATPLAPISGGNQQVCATSPIQTLTATATANTDESVVWYSAAVGGTIVTNPTLNAIGTITYYAQSVNNTTACYSDNRTPVVLTIDNCAIQITKEGSVVDADSNGTTNAGDTIQFNFNVTNTGNVALANVTVTDTYLPGLVLTGSPIPSLPSGASNATAYTATYVVTQADIDNGFVYNTASVTGTSPSAESITDNSSDTTPCNTCPVNPTCLDCTIVDIVQDPKVSLEKEGTWIDTNGDGWVSLGDTISFNFTVTNTGNVTLSNPVITDTSLTPALVVSAVTPATLAPNQQGTATASYAITQEDIDLGAVYNIAEVTANDPQGNPVIDMSQDPSPLLPSDPFYMETCPECTVVILQQQPSITVIKTAMFNDNNADGFAQAGETITYSFTVSNTGNVPLTDVHINDPLTGVSISGGPITLAVGASDSSTFVGTYALTQQDIINGSVSNQATALGTSPLGIVVSDLSDDNSPTENDATIVTIDGCTLEIFNAVTPNDDGFNDLFYIRGIECYPNNTVEVYNRWGVLVYSVDGYNNNDRAFKGISEGRTTIKQADGLPSGTYFYVIKYTNFTGEGLQKAGYLYINRD